MIIIFDTNIWLEELALNSSLGSAVRFFLRRHNAQLALPEVVRLEVERNFQEKLKQFVANIRANHRQLLAVFGKLKEIVLPDDAEIEGKVAEIFSGIGVDLLEIPFSFDSAKSSFLKTIQKLPPSSQQSQQFKDGVLWADCVNLLQEDDVLLVTSDSAFFHERKYNQGLAKNLITEVADKAHQLKIFHCLSELLSDIKTEVTIDEEFLARAFMEAHAKAISDDIQRNGFAPGDIFEIRKAVYATVNPTVLYVELKIDMACDDLSDQERTNVVLHLSGCGNYNIEAACCDDVRITGQEFEFLLADGVTRKSILYNMGFINAVLGHRDITHSVRYKLTDSM